MRLVENNNGSLNIEALAKEEVSDLIDALLTLRLDLDRDDYEYPIIYHWHANLRRAWNGLYAPSVAERGSRK